MIFSLDTLHEKSWFKSLAAVTAFLVSVAALGRALIGYVDHPAATIAAATAVSAPAVQQVVSAAPGQRAVDDALKQQITKELPDKDVVILVVGARGDNEAAKYARDIQDYLKGQGYRNASLSFTSFPSLHGVDIEKDGNRAFIKVGHQ